jgi:hypothetical protein
LFASRKGAKSQIVKRILEPQRHKGHEVNQRNEHAGWQPSTLCVLCAFVVICFGPLRMELLVVVFEVGGAEEDQAQAPQAGAVGGDALEIQAGRAAEDAECGPERGRP